MRHDKETQAIFTQNTLNQSNQDLSLLGKIYDSSITLEQNILKSRQAKRRKIAKIFQF